MICFAKRKLGSSFQLDKKQIKRSLTPFAQERSIREQRRYEKNQEAISFSCHAGT